MNNKIDNKKEKTLVKELREIRDKINLEIQDLSLDQLKEYWKTKETLHPNRYFQNQG